MMSSKSKGILCIILSALSFSFMSLFIKLSGNVPTLQKSLFRNLVAAFVALILLLKDKPAVGCTKNPLDMSLVVRFSVPLASFAIFMQSII